MKNPFGEPNGLNDRSQGTMMASLGGEDPSDRLDNLRKSLGVQRVTLAQRFCVIGMKIDREWRLYLNPGLQPNVCVYLPNKKRMHSG